MKSSEKCLRSPTLKTLFISPIDIQFLIFWYFRPLKKTIPVKQEPTYEFQNGVIVIRFVVTCRSQPVVTWMHGTRSIAVIGRYKQEIVKEGAGYAITLKVDQVGLKSILSLTLSHVGLPPTITFHASHQYTSHFAMTVLRRVYFNQFYPTKTPCNFCCNVWIWKRTFGLTLQIIIIWTSHPSPVVCWSKATDYSVSDDIDITPMLVNLFALCDPELAFHTM